LRLLLQRKSQRPSQLLLWKRPRSRQLPKNQLPKNQLPKNQLPKNRLPKNQLPSQLLQRKSLLPPIQRPLKNHRPKQRQPRRY
jgi:hypothetical protein